MFANNVVIQKHVELTNTRHLTRLKITCIKDGIYRATLLSPQIWSGIRKSAVIMGLFFSRLYSIFEAFSSETPARILMLGLDGAGRCCTKFKAYISYNWKKTIQVFF